MTPATLCAVVCKTHGQTCYKRHYAVAASTQHVHANFDGSDCYFLTWRQAKPPQEAA